MTVKEHSERKPPIGGQGLHKFATEVRVTSIGDEVTDTVTEERHTPVLHDGEVVLYNVVIRIFILRHYGREHRDICGVDFEIEGDWQRQRLIEEHKEGEPSIDGPPVFTQRLQ